MMEKERYTPPDKERYWEIVLQFGSNRGWREDRNCLGYAIASFNSGSKEGADGLQPINIRRETTLEPRPFSKSPQLTIFRPSAQKHNTIKARS